MDCLFCKIIKGELPSYKIYEDDDVLAFLDIMQEGYGHTLVVPKSHCENVLDCDVNALKSVMSAVKVISNHYVKNCGFDGVNLFINNGVHANQKIFHLHFHIIPRKKDDEIASWKLPKYNFNLEDVKKDLEVK